MKTLYIECNMGAAGDMLTAALLELSDAKEEILSKLNALGIPGVEFSSEKSVKCGITGTHMNVKVNGEEEESLDHYHEHEHEHEHEHHHEHEHEHEHGHEHEHEHEHEHGHHHEHEHEHEHEHHHNHEHEHHHEHHHEHEHEHEHGQEHGHHHEHEHDHHHSSLHDIEHIVRGHLPVSDKVKDDVMAIYKLIAEAESHVHGVPVTEIHFHEVGTMDAIADITAVCMMMEEIAPEKIVVSPIHVGSGQVRCAHGILPVPAPATAHILSDVPIYGGSVKGELCTPTGAAILKHFATEFGNMPVMTVKKVGYGMGKKDFEAANCVRVVLGETKDQTNTVVELSCNVDDMTPEALGFAMNELFREGALEVYTVPVGMKKSRPGILLCTMCKENDKDKMVELIFKHTTTIGIREQISNRYTLNRRIETVETPFGVVRKKISEGFGVKREKLEYDDLAMIAEKEGMSLGEVRKIVEKY
ncbi:MAG: nickel pincer cofactor biosynthesis protein LarC [Lachnospiraceae bacterium]|nr:nickel pincer cofactor biosynthesis protein LarC [Lachnospiraceae bacterium]